MRKFIVLTVLLGIVAAAGCQLPQMDATALPIKAQPAEVRVAIQQEVIAKAIEIAVNSTKESPTLLHLMNQKVVVKICGVFPQTNALDVNHRYDTYEYIRTAVEAHLSNNGAGIVSSTDNSAQADYCVVVGVAYCGADVAMESAGTRMIYKYIGRCELNLRLIPRNIEVKGVTINGRGSYTINYREDFYVPSGKGFGIPIFGGRGYGR